MLTCMTDETVAQLKATRASLASRRDRYDALVAELAEMIKQTDRMIEVLGADDAGEAVPVPRESPTIREAVLGVLSDDKPHHFNEFMKKLGFVGPPPKDASVRGVVSRMKRDGEITSLGQGKYEITSKGRAALAASEEREDRGAG